MYIIAVVLAIHGQLGLMVLFADFLGNNKRSRKFYFLKKLFITKPYHYHRYMYYSDTILKLIIISSLFYICDLYCLQWEGVQTAVSYMDRAK
jgi:hypothetical protein